MSCCGRLLVWLSIYIFVSVLQSIRFNSFNSTLWKLRWAEEEDTNTARCVHYLSNRHVSRCYQLKISSSLVFLSHCWCHVPGRSEAVAATPRARLYCAVGGRESIITEIPRRHFRWSCPCKFGLLLVFFFRFMCSAFKKSYPTLPHRRRRESRQPFRKGARHQQHPNSTDTAISFFVACSNKTVACSNTHRTSFSYLYFWYVQTSKQPHHIHHPSCRHRTPPSSPAG